MKQFVLGVSVGALVSLLTGTNLLAGVFHTAQSLAQTVAAPVLGFEKERRKAWSLT